MYIIEKHYISLGGIRSGRSYQRIQNQIQTQKLKQMIKGFEEYTKPLTEFEKECKPTVVKMLKLATGKEKAIKNITLARFVEIEHEKKISSARIRKIINHIRTNHEVSCLIASSKGYYIAETIEEIQDYLQGLYQRSMTILNVYKHVKQQAKEEFGSQLKLDV